MSSKARTAAIAIAVIIVFAVLVVGFVATVQSTVISTTDSTFVTSSAYYQTITQTSTSTQSVFSGTDVMLKPNYYDSYSAYLPAGTGVQVSWSASDTVNVYIFNSALPQTVQTQVSNAIVSLFAPRPGILMTNFYESDLEQAAFASSPGQISYVEVVSPTGSMIVTAPTSPQITYTLVPGGGSLSELVYAYGISTTLQNGQVGTPVNWVFPQVISTTADYGITLEWPEVPNAATYTVWGRSTGAGIGILATVEATTAETYTFTDTGSVTPTGGPPQTIANTPIQYNTLASAPVINVFYSERQQQIDSTSPTRSSIG